MRWSSLFCACVFTVGCGDDEQGPGKVTPAHDGGGTDGGGAGGGNSGGSGATSSIDGGSGSMGGSAGTQSCQPTTGDSATYKALWISKQELDSLPTSGAAWDAMVNAADGAFDTTSIGTYGTYYPLQTFAAALAAARLAGHDEALADTYRNKALAGLKQFTTDPIDGTEVVTAIGRVLSLFPLSADLVNLPTRDPAFDAVFRERLVHALDYFDPAGAPPNTNRERARRNVGNGGAMSRVAYVAVALYLGDQAMIQDAADTFKSWLGDTAIHRDWIYKNSEDDYTWYLNDPPNVATDRFILPKGATKEGDNFDGFVPCDMYRNGSWLSPSDPARASGEWVFPGPSPTVYPYVTAEAVVPAAELLHRACYPARAWSDEAVKRMALAFARLHEIGSTQGWEYFPGGRESLPPLLNFMYPGLGLTEAPPGGLSKQARPIGWTHWTHGER